MALICTVCGAENMEGSIYCEDCGARLPVASGSPAATPAPIAAPPAATIADTPPPITPTPVAVPSTPQEAVAAAASGRPRLESTETGQTFILSKDENLVGRRSPVDGIFPEVDLTEADKDSYISRRHGKIIMGEQGAVYEDLGSSNGSFHNGNRLQQGVQAKLSEGDNLRLGRTELVYHTN